MICSRNFLTAAVLSLGLSLPAAGACPALAAGPGEETPVESESLKDNVMEYEELADLIGYYNVSVVNSEASATNTDSLATAEELRMEARDLLTEAADLKEEGLEEGGNQALYDAYKANAKALRTYAGDLEDASDPSGNVKIQLKRMKASQTQLAQSLMIQYQKLLDQKALADKNAQLAAAQYESALRKQQLGMMSGAEVTAEEQAMKSAQAAAVGAAKDLEDTKYNLCIMTGWNYDSNPEIRPVPLPDSSRIAEMNPEADLQEAVGNNFDQQEIRHAGASGRAARRSKSRNIDQAEQSLAITLQTLYSDVLNKKAAYEGACAAYEAAQSAMNAAVQKKNMGMLSNIEYLQEESGFLSAKASKNAAELDYFWAMETYDWAVEGLVTAGEGGQQ